MNTAKAKEMIGCNKLSANKAQALVELAIFGSILLLCVSVLIQYGLEGNFSQMVQMEAFRKALKLAYNSKGLGSSSSLVLVKDKPMPDPRDQWGFAERYPIMGSGGAVWDSSLADQYVLAFDNPDYPPKPEDLPKVYFEIDKADLSDVNRNFPAGLPPVPAASGIDQNQVFGFYTAQLEKIECSKLGTIYVVMDDPSCPGSSPTCSDYKVEPVACGDIRVWVPEAEGIKNDITDDQLILMAPYYKDQNGLKRRIISVDLDSTYEQDSTGWRCTVGDCEPETIIAANCKPDEPGVIYKFLYLEQHNKNETYSKQGTLYGSVQLQLDTTYTALQPYPYGPKGATVTDKQGIIGDSEKTITHLNSRIVKETNKGVITDSHTELDASQKITHKVRLNLRHHDGTPLELEIPADFTVKKADLYNW